MLRVDRIADDVSLPGFEATAQWLGLAVFAMVCVGFYRRVLAAAH